jgi:hypothetical protein
LSESKTRSAELPDIEPEDFVRFLEYAYRANYTVPSWTQDESVKAVSEIEEHEPPPIELVNEEPLPPPELPHDEVPQWSFEAPAMHESSSYPANLKKKKKGPRSTGAILRSSFQRRTYLWEQAPDAILRASYEPKPNTDATQDFTPVFLAHARLYTFANMRLVDSLKDLTLDKLHKSLVGFQLYPERVRDVVELVRYAYDNGPDRTEHGVLNDLRHLVVEYVACEVEIVGTDKEFKALLEEGGEFVGDFWGLVSKNWL